MDVHIGQKPGLYCDTGPHEGEYRIDINGNIYLTHDEYVKWTKGQISLGIRFTEPDAIVDSLTPDQMSVNLCGIEDWLREQPARHSGYMADVVHRAWAILEGRIDTETMSHDMIKAATRKRMAETGEPYSVARREVIRQHAEAIARRASDAEPASPIPSPPVTEDHSP